MTGTVSKQPIGGISIPELLESKRMLEAIISSSSDAIIAIDPEKRIIKFSQRAETLLGYSESEMIGHSVERLHEDRAKAKEIYRAIQDFGKIDLLDIVLVTKDGRKIPISFSGKLILDERGNILGQVGFVRDIRENQLLEIRLKALIETSKAINSIYELREILHRVVLSALLAIPAADRGSIHFYFERSGKLNLMISSFDYSKISSETLSFQLKEGIAGWVFEHQQPVIIRDTIADARYRQADNRDVKPHLSMLCVPITSKRRKIGVMSLSNSAKIEAFSQTDLDLLIGFADQAAIAIDNVEEMTGIKKEAEELDFLRNFSLKINAQTNIEEILTALLEGGNKLLGSEMAVVHWKGMRGGIFQSFVVPTELQNLMTNPRLEDGLTAEVFRTGNPVVVPDTMQDARVNPLVQGAGIQSIVGYPLQLHGQVSGALFFNSRQSQFFGEHEIHLISLLLPVAAIAIENSNIIERLERNKYLSESLVQVSSKLAATQVLEEQMVALKHFMHKELDAPTFFLGLYDETDDRIYFKIDYEDGTDLELSSISMKNEDSWTISSYVIKERKPIIWYNDARKRSEGALLGIKPLQTNTNCQTCVAFPLVVEGKSLGVISIQSEHPFAWNEIEVSIFETLAHQASIAIRNTKLHQQINKAHDTAISVAQMTALGDLNSTLDTIVGGVKDVLGCDIVTLYTYQQDKEQFALPPATAGKIRFPEKLIGILVRETAPYKIIARDDIYVSEDSQNDPVLGTPFARRENIYSSVGVPLKMHNRKVGVLFINYCDEKHFFTKEELSNIQLYSSQAAVAISNAILYEDEQRRREVVKIIDEAGRTVTSYLQTEEIYENLARHAYQLTGEKGELATFATINIIEGNHTILKATYPPIDEENFVDHNLAKADLNVGVNGRIGIIGRAVKKRASVLVKDVKFDSDYLCANQDTKSELAVPIIYQNEVVGVINVEHQKIGGLDEEDLQNIELLAAHAAVAIQNARIYQALQRKSQHQQAIYEVSKIINSSLERTEKGLLNLLVEQMVTEIVPAAGASNNLGTILLYDHENNELKVACNYPEEEFASDIKNQIRSLSHPQRGRIGISGRAVITKKSQRVDDVAKDRDYLNNNEKTRSELDVPILEGDTVLGVLSLQCDQLNGFDLDTEGALRAFAELAAIAIQNTRRYQELKEAQAMVGNITAVAWMGLVAGAWRHSIGNMATTISDLSLLAQKDLENGEATEKINRRLNKIQGIVEEIEKIPMPPLSSEDGIDSIYICQFVRDRINQFRSKKERYRGIDFKIAFEIDELALVRASPEWLRRILDILVDNAKNAMINCDVKRINTVLSLKNEGVEILILDTGTGIPENIQKILLKKPIPKEKDEKGSGIGLFLANSIIQVYGGQLKIRSTGLNGTTMALWLPLQK